MSSITYNALLRPLNFAKVKDPYTAFQEIAMWVSNLAAPQKDMPIISNKMKIATHGFDEWSFRREPGGK